MLARQRILEGRYRASGRFKVVPYLDLGVREQRLLVSLDSGEPERSGVLVPTRAGVSARAVDGDTIRLLASLSQPGPLPHNLMIALGNRGPTTIARMVLDGVLEVEASGRFLTGADASPTVFGRALSLPRASGCGAMSLAAVEYGASLRIDDPIVVSRRMYRFNTQPATPQQRRRFPDRRAVAGLLGLDVLDDRVLGRPGLEPDEGGGWFSWTLLGPDVPPHEGPYFKLYVSPPVERLAETFRVVSSLLVNRTGAVSFKVGANLRGILRPDKLVAYFTTRTESPRERNSMLQRPPSDLRSPIHLPRVSHSRQASMNLAFCRGGWIRLATARPSNGWASRAGVSG